MKDYPLIKFVILFIGGIIFGRFLVVDLLLFCIAALLILTVFLSLLLFKKSGKPPAALIIVALLLPLFCGYLIYSIYAINKNELLPPSLQKEKNFTAYGMASVVELKRNKEVVFECVTDSVRIFNSTYPANVILICKLRDESKRALDSIYNTIYPGNTITLEGTYHKGRERRNPGEFDYNNYLNEKGISGILISYDAADLNITDNQKDFFESLIFDCRKYIDNQIHELHNSETSALLRGLILADRTEMDFETKTSFINSGVVHVLAVSGLHVGYIALIFLFLFGRLNPYLRSGLTIVGLFCFMIITGVPPSVFRATIMAVVVIIAFLSNRSSNIFNSLALAAFIILLFNPAELFNAGFQLSFAAVLSIAAIYPVLKKETDKISLPFRIKGIILFALVSLSAQIGTLPFTLYYFNKLSVIALLANLLVIPLIGVILSIGFFSLFLSVFSFFLASLASSLNELLTSLLYYIVNIAGNEDYSFFPVRQFSLLDALILYILVFITVIFYSRIKGAFLKVIFLIIITFNIILLCSLDDKEILKKGELNVLMIDVGQGDSFLIQFPNGQTALIDAGEANPFFDNGERIVRPLLDHLGINKIDYGFISHMDADHYSGYVSLIHEERIRQIIKPQVDTSLTDDIKFEKFAKKMNVPVTYYENKRYLIGGADIQVLSDTHIPEYITFSNNNKSSLIRLVYGKTSFLFTGDIEWPAESIYRERYKEMLKTDVLKVAHHGSATSTIPSFVSYVKPSVSLISAGIKNKFNHPSKRVLDRLKAMNSKIHRTDLEGAVLYRSNGDSVYFVNWRLSEP